MDLRNIEDLYELSPLQEGMLFHSLYEPQSGVYIEQLSCELLGPLDASRFEAAWQQVIDRHTALRSSFSWNDLEKPLQIVHRQVSAPLERLDWSELPGSEQERRLERFVRRESVQDFDLTAGPPLRLALIRLAPERHHFVWCFHHLLMDGWCLPILLRELFTVYDALGEGRRIELSPSRPYSDYIGWLQEQDLEGARAFWSETLKGASAPTSIVSRAFSTNGTDPGDYQSHHAVLSPSLSSALQKLARDNQLTPQVVVQGAVAVLLSRHSGRRDVLFGTSVSGRPPELPGVEQIVGLFINTLPLYLQVAPDAHLRSWLKELQARQTEMQQYEFTPLVEIHRCSDVPPGQPLFETLFVFENYPVGPALQAPAVGVRLARVRSQERTHFPLSITVVSGEQLSFRFTYKTAHFAQQDVQRLGGHLRRLLLGFVEDLDRPMGRLPMLSAAERHQLLHEWNPAPASATARTVPEQVAAVAAGAPDALAVKTPGECLSYGELARCAGELAQVLHRRGVGAEVRVGVACPRGPELPVALLATLAAGGAYVPLDLSQPRPRLATLARDAGLALVLVAPGQEEAFAEPGLPRLTVGGEPLRAAPRQALPSPLPESLAYVLYTSGSTGQPKGVGVTHRGMAHYLGWAVEAYRVHELSHAAVATAIGFDLSVTGLFSPLLAGRAVLLLPEEGALEALAQALAFDPSPCLLKLTPSHLELLGHFHAALGSTITDRRDVLILGGEALLGESLAAWCRLAPRSRVVNEYGPTESVVGCTVHALPAGEAPSGPVSIGRPIPGARIVLLGHHRELAPQGAPGELAVGGESLARGYLHRPAATAQRFVPDPSAPWPGARLYRTGDLARWGAGDSLEYLGRLDAQLKVRGYRVEPGEIEAALQEHPGVRRAAVALAPVAADEEALVAYVAGDDPGLEVALEEHLRSRLPEPMIPRAWVFLPALPLTPNGKVDRRALPAPGTAQVSPAEGYQPPRTPPEEQLVRCFEEVLGKQPIGITDNFFVLGGHSLLAVRLMARIEARLGQQFPLALLFRDPTVAGLSAFLEDRFRPGFLRRQGLDEGLPFRQPLLVSVRPGEERLPFFFVAPLGGLLPANIVMGQLELARHIDPARPFWGIQPTPVAEDLCQQLSATTPPKVLQERVAAWRAGESLLPDLARRTLAELRGVQPQGPYLLGGFCSGAFLAFEMACQLAEAGEEVARVLLVDSASPLRDRAPEPPRRWQLFRRRAERKREAADVAWVLFYDLAGGKLETSREAIYEELLRRPTSRWWSYAAELLAADGIVPPDTPPGEIARFFVVRDGNLSSMRKIVAAYRPPVFPGRLDVVATEDQANGARDLTFGWQQLAREPVVTTIVPGNHSTLFTEPQVGELAAVMNHLLAKV